MLNNMRRGVCVLGAFVLLFAFFSCALAETTPPEVQEIHPLSHDVTIGADALTEGRLVHYVVAVSALILLGVVTGFLLLLRKQRFSQRHLALEQAHKSELLRIAEIDDLTGLYNKKKFLREVEGRLRDNPDTHFLLIRVGIDRFQLFSTYMGEAEGDKLIKYMAAIILGYAGSTPLCLVGHIDVDVFAILRPFHGEANAIETVRFLRGRIRDYDAQYDITPDFGLYVVDNPRLPVSAMLDCAALAAKTITDSYPTDYAFYSEALGDTLLREQELINDMPAALREKQFFLMIQPKYDLQTNTPVGGEALVRWRHPVKGLLPPGAFLPTFEKHGQVMKLDLYVWNAACALLRKWIDEGLNPRPLSVNVSRIDLYHPQIVDTLCDMIAKYDLPPAMLELEVTESAYTDNPEMMQQLIAELRLRGFPVLMDDFGSGYSSLNMLKNITVDVLKIDMKFLEECAIPGRGQNILASVVRMAKWIGLPVIAEGVEKLEQVEFLRSIGCEYAQGYYYSKPLNIEDYLALEWITPEELPTRAEQLDVDSVWSSDPKNIAIFNDPLSAVAIYEYDTEMNTAECLRVNKTYCDMFGYEDAALTMQTPFVADGNEYRARVLRAFREAAEGETVSYDLLRHTVSGRIKWVRATFRKIGETRNRALLMNVMSDITAQMEINRAMERSAARAKPCNTMLVVDDQKINRDLMRRIFSATFEVIEATNGQEALDLLREKSDAVGIILLDMMMPVMNGAQFLEIKRNDHLIDDIPVIIITSENSARQQMDMLALGANDYIVKPIAPELVMRRVNNVLETSHRFRSLLKEYRRALEKSRTDPLTHVYNRAAMEDAVTAILRDRVDETHALIMIDIDDYKVINDTYGHTDGDAVLTGFGNRLTEFFRAGDLTARMGGDEFCVFMLKVRSSEDVKQKCLALCDLIASQPIGEESIRITCSVGVALSAPDSTFHQLYRDADSALYRAKALGKNRAEVYGEESGTPADE